MFKLDVTYYIVSTRKVQSYKLSYVYAIVRYVIILEYEIMKDFFILDIYSFGYIVRGRILPLRDEEHEEVEGEEE